VIRTQIVPFIDLEEYNDEDTPASDFDEDEVHRTEVMEWEEKDKEQPHEDETYLVKDLCGEEDVEAYVEKLDTRSREEFNKSMAYLLWTEKCNVWVTAIGTVKEKMEYISDYIDTFEGNYAQLMHSGLLEDIVEMVPECWEASRT
jgi:hypothetical protein